VSTEPTPRDPALELLDRLRDEASERVGRELDDLRAHLIKCCEHSIERLRKCGFVSLESVTSVVVALTEVAASERDRANRLSNLLESAESELESVQADHRDGGETARRLEQELHDARDTATRAAEEQRAQFAASRDRLQHVIDAQSLELMELRRELGKANRGAEAPVARRPALDAGRPALSARERLAETLPFDAIDAALSATPPVTDWPKAV
jgi:DNA repair exonuclease SbcCD ATPase subunit